VLGLGAAALAVTTWGWAATFAGAAVVSLLAARATVALHRPGLPRTLPLPRLPEQRSSRYAA
jgi:hypothetical protein